MSIRCRAQVSPLSLERRITPEWPATHSSPSALATLVRATRVGVLSWVHCPASSPRSTMPCSPTANRPALVRARSSSRAFVAKGRSSEGCTEGSVGGGSWAVAALAHARVAPRARTSGVRDRARFKDMEPSRKTGGAVKRRPRRIRATSTVARRISGRPRSAGSAARNLPAWPGSRSRTAGLLRCPAGPRGNDPTSGRSASRWSTRTSALRSS